MAGTPINFDHLSNCPLHPDVWEVMEPFLREHHGSPAALHRDGLKARDALDASREQFRSMIQADSPEDIVFTSSGTEAVNLGIKGSALKLREQGNRIVTTGIEHPSVNRSLDWLESQGFEIERLPVDSKGCVKAGQFKEAADSKTILIATHLANYDIGTIQPVRDIASFANERGIPLFLDATYAAGWMPLDVRELGVAMVALAPHRFYGPKGTGILYRHRRVRLEPLLHGGDQEEGLRAGTENVAGIAGAGKAAELAARQLESRIDHVRSIQQQVWQALQEKIPAIELNGPEPGRQRMANQLNVSPKSSEGEGLMLMCDVQGIRIGAGTACMTHAEKASPVLSAIGASKERIKAATLLSFGEDNHEGEINRFIEVYAKMVDRLREMSA